MVAETKSLQWVGVQAEVGIARLLHNHGGGMVRPALTQLHKREYTPYRRCAVRCRVVVRETHFLALGTSVVLREQVLEPNGA